jgi:hypothetical protein
LLGEQARGRHAIGLLVQVARQVLPVGVKPFLSQGQVSLVGIHQFLANRQSFVPGCLAHEPKQPN